MKNLMPHFIANKYQQGQFTGKLNAVTMFLDISGFTVMTEDLMQHGKEGAEILAGILDNIFDKVISKIYAADGFISNFAGDAFTAIFPGSQKADSAIACAINIRETFHNLGKQKTKYGGFELFVKQGMSYGEVDWGIIKSEKHKAYYFRGEAINGCAYAEHQCEKMDIVLDNKILSLIKAEQIEIIPMNNSYYKLLKIKDNIQLPEINPLSYSIHESVLGKFIPGPVIEQNIKGEFREVVSIFISFQEMEMTGLIKIFDEMIKLCNRFHGYLDVIDFGDKGANSLIIFGIPKSYENNLNRALDFALSMRSMFSHKIRMGITSGTVFAGFKGSNIRSSYGVLGSAVNLSARLMMKAEYGEILTTETISRSINYCFEFKGRYQLKGIEEKLSTFNLLGKNENIDLSFFKGEMVGRTKELKLLNQYSLPLISRKFAGIVILYGEAGMGKSRLAHEFTKSHPDVQTLIMQTDNILRISMNPFKYFMLTFFRQLEAQNINTKRKYFEEIYDKLLADLAKLKDPRSKEIIKELKRTRSILSSQIEIFYESSLYEMLDPKGRYENTIFAYKEFFKALSLINPIIIQIEDIHWLDEDSPMATKFSWILLNHEHFSKAS